jgi:hypothetical protein
LRGNGIGVVAEHGHQVRGLPRGRRRAPDGLAIQAPGPHAGPRRGQPIPGHRLPRDGRHLHHGRPTHHVQFRGSVQFPGGVRLRFRGRAAGFGDLIALGQDRGGEPGKRVVDLVAVQTR